MQNVSRIIIIPPPSLFPYKAKARTNPPIIARPPFAIFAIAALGVVLVVEADVVEGVEEVLAAVLCAVVKVEESVRFELGEGVAKLEVVFALVEVETTVTVDEGTEEVDVLVYDGPGESLIVVVEPPTIEDEADPDPLIWNG